MTQTLNSPLNFSTSSISVQKKYLVTFVWSLKVFHTKGFLNVRVLANEIQKMSLKKTKHYHI